MFRLPERLDALRGVEQLGGEQLDVPVADVASSKAVATANAVPEVPTEELPSTPLAERMHDVWVSEAVVDPDGGAALTLDSGGGVRLWPKVRDSEAARAFEELGARGKGELQELPPVDVKPRKGEILFEADERE